MGGLLNKSHHLFGHFEASLGIVGDVQAEKKVGKPHDAETDLTVAFHHFIDFRYGVVGHVDGVVQETDRITDSFPKTFIVNRRCLAAAVDKFCKADGSQVTGFQGQQWLFSAGVGALDFTQKRRGVVAVDPVQKNDARIPCFPGLLHQSAIHFGRFEFSGFNVVAGVDQIIGSIGLDCVHECFGQPDRYVKIVEIAVGFLAGDELQDVGMIYS